MNYLTVNKMTRKQIKSLIILGVGLVLIPSFLSIIVLVPGLTTRFIIAFFFLLAWVLTNVGLTELYIKVFIPVKIKVRVLKTSANSFPMYAKVGDSGMDIRYDAINKGTYAIAPGERCILETGIYADIPTGYEIQVRPRSGLAAKYGLSVLNSPGTIDSSYKGEIKIILINHSKVSFKVLPSERIAQLVLVKVEKIEWIPVSTLRGSDRGVHGLGSTGRI